MVSDEVSKIIRGNRKKDWFGMLRYLVLILWIMESYYGILK